MSDPPGGRPPWLPPEGSEQFPTHLHTSGQGAAAVAAPGHSHIPISDTTQGAQSQPSNQTFAASRAAPPLSTTGNLNSVQGQGLFTPHTASNDAPREVDGSEPAIATNLSDSFSRPSTAVPLGGITPQSQEATRKLQAVVRTVNVCLQDTSFVAGIEGNHGPRLLTAADDVLVHLFLSTNAPFSAQQIAGFLAKSTQEQVKAQILHLESDGAISGRGSVDSSYDDLMLPQNSPLSAVREPPQPSNTLQGR